MKDVCIALLIMEFFRFVSSSEAPITVNVGRNLEPYLYRDDLIFSTNYRYPNDIVVGDIVILKTKKFGNYVTHRVIKKDDHKNLYMTKGDNKMDDLNMLKNKWISRDAIIGKMRLRIPKLGIFLRIYRESPLWIQLCFLVSFASYFGF